MTCLNDFPVEKGLYRPKTVAFPQYHCDLNVVIIFTAGINLIREIKKFPSYVYFSALYLGMSFAFK